MGSGVSPTMLIWGQQCLECLEGGDRVGGFCFEEEAAEGDVLFSDVRAVTAPWSAASCITDTGIEDTDCRPWRKAKAQAVQAFSANAFS